MKNLHNYMIIGSMALTIGFSSCNNEEAAIMPTVDLAAMNFTHEPGEGQITLKWDAPADPANAGFMYMEMKYTDPRDKVTRTKTISPYTNEIVIPNTRARYGDAYSFTFTPYSSTDTPGKSFVLDKCKSNAAPSTVTVSRVKLTLTNLKTNAQEPQEGPIANLTDGNPSTFFHTQWSGTPPTEKHWIAMDLGEDVDRLEIHTWNRVHSNPNPPATVELYRLESLDETEPGEPFYTYQHTVKTSGGEFQMMYPAQTEDAMTEPVRYLRYSSAATGSNNFWNMAEMVINKVIVNKFDPETDEKEVGE